MKHYPSYTITIMMSYNIKVMKTWDLEFAFNVKTTFTIKIIFVIMHIINVYKYKYNFYNECIQLVI